MTPNRNPIISEKNASKSARMRQQIKTDSQMNYLSITLTFVLNIAAAPTLKREHSAFVLFLAEIFFF